MSFRLHRPRARHAGVRVALLRRTLLPALLGATALAAPSPVAAAGQPFQQTVPLRCTPSASTAPLQVTVRGQAPTSTAPGEAIRISDLELTVTAGVPFTQLPVPGPPRYAVMDSSFEGMTFSAVGAEPDALTTPEGSQALPRVTESTGSSQTKFTVDVPRIASTSAGVTAGSAPVVLRPRTLSFRTATSYDPAAPALPLGPLQTCTVDTTAAPLAIVKSTGAIPDAPVVESISPASGYLPGGETVTVKGRNFTNARSVDGLYGSPLTVVDDQTIEVVAQEGFEPRTVPIEVVTDFGRSVPNPAVTYTWKDERDEFAPTAPTGLKVVRSTAGTSAELTWEASTDNVGVTFYEVLRKGSSMSYPTAAAESFTGLDPSRSEVFQVRAVDAVMNRSAWVEVTLPPLSAAPLPPTEVPNGFANVRPGTVDLRWGASPTVGVTGYAITYDDIRIVVPASELSRRLTNLLEDADYLFEITAIGADGVESAPLLVTGTTWHGDGDVSAPTIPTDVRAVRTPDGTAIDLAWTASTDDVGVAGYDVYVDGQFKVSTLTNKATITGVDPLRPYTLTVRAWDLVLNRSAPSTPVFSPPSALCNCRGDRYDMAGSATVKTLAKGTLPLKGRFDFALNVQTAAISGDLTLDPTQARLTVLGFIPVTAKVAFVTSGKTTGSLRNNDSDDAFTLTTKTLARIKLPEVKLFGTVPLGGGSTCQTRSLSTIDLKSAAFDLAKGGTLTGTFAISNLSGCGALNGLVSPLTAGGGNTMKLALTRRP